MKYIHSVEKIGNCPKLGCGTCSRNVENIVERVKNVYGKDNVVIERVEFYEEEIIVNGNRLLIESYSMDLDNSCEVAISNRSKGGDNFVKDFIKSVLDPLKISSSAIDKVYEVE